MLSNCPPSRTPTPISTSKHIPGLAVMTAATFCSRFVMSQRKLNTLWHSSSSQPAIRVCKVFNRTQLNSSPRYFNKHTCDPVSNKGYMPCQTCRFLIKAFEEKKAAEVYDSVSIFCRYMKPLPGGRLHSWRSQCMLVIDTGLSRSRESKTDHWVSFFYFCQMINSGYYQWILQ